MVWHYGNLHEYFLLIYGIYIMLQRKTYIGQISESFNNKFKSLIEIHHLNNWMFIEALQRSNSLAIIKLLNIQTGKK